MLEINPHTSEIKNIATNTAVDPESGRHYELQRTKTANCLSQIGTDYRSYQLKTLLDPFSRI